MGGLKIMRQKITTKLGGVLVFACVANAGFAQTQAGITNGTQTSGDQSAAALAQGKDCERVGASHHWYNRDDQTSGCYYCEIVRAGQLWRKPQLPAANR
jgi:hypothetical protein